MVTMKDIAAATGVSVATVSHAFNRPDRLSAAKRREILDTAESLGYSGPHALASSLRTGSVGAIGFVMSDRLSYAVEDPGSLLLLQGIARATEQADTVLSVFPLGGPGSGRPTEADHDRALAVLQRGVVDGFVAFNLPDDHRAIRAVISRGSPFVIVDAPRVTSIGWVGIDERAAAKAAADHLVALGHRNIGVVVDRLAPDGVSGVVSEARLASACELVPRERLAGYSAAVDAAGLGHLTIVEAGGFSPAAARGAAATLLSVNPDVTGILAASDVMALGVMDVLTEHRLPVPDTVSVVGFDDIPSAAERGLTTVHQPLLEKGRLAATMLLEVIAGRAPESVTLPWTLVERATTASPRSAGTRT